MRISACAILALALAFASPPEAHAAPAPGNETTVEQETEKERCLVVSKLRLLGVPIPTHVVCGRVTDKNSGTN